MQQKQESAVSILALQMLEELEKAISQLNNVQGFRETSVYKELTSSSDEVKKSLILNLIDRLQKRKVFDGYYFTYTYFELLNEFFKSIENFEEEDILQIAQKFSMKVSERGFRNAIDYPYQAFLDVIEKFVKKFEFTPMIGEALDIIVFKENLRYNADNKKLNKRIFKFFQHKKAQYFNVDSIGNMLEYFLKNSNNENLWVGLINHLAKEKEKSIPTTKWIDFTKTEITKFDKKQLTDFINSLCQLAISTLQEIHKSKHIPEIIFHENNEQILRGAVWLAGLLDEDSLNQKIDELGLLCFKKYAGVGGLLVKVGNGCIYAFSLLPEKKGIASLSKFRIKLKYASALKLVDKYITQLAEKTGKTSDELEDWGVPTFGLDASHQFQEHFGDYAGQILINPNGKVELKWTNANGKEQKTVPTYIKSNFSQELKLLTQKVKEIQNMLPVQSQRIEQFYLKLRTWNFIDWKSAYLDNGFLSFLTQRLIWFFEKEDKKEIGLFYQGKFLNSKKQEIDWIDEQTKVQLWHPLGFEVETVMAWRNLLTEFQIVQPFKQAYREVYLVTDAELNTLSYSNRFAAHILRQHQFTVLCKLRGWKYTLQGSWDSSNTPIIDLKNWKIRAEFWVDANWEGLTTNAGIFQYIYTDQVRFYEEGRLLNMNEIPALVFSEIMRDADMFVGVCSIGNDANWTDRGNRHELNYWHSYSFGEINSESAKIRKQVLENLIPRLKIAKVCEIKERYLVVRGKRHTYSIHIGSGNIMMENNQYLCIVPERGAKNSPDKVFLPFEGDGILSIIISKAFLLAEDDKIKDKTITRQL